MDYLLGILGGMGPAATVDFMGKVVALTDARNDQAHIPMLAASIPDIPDRSAFLLRGGESPLPALERCLRLLEDSGAQCIVMPCNTAHFWFDDLRGKARGEMLSIIDAVADEARDAGFLRVGLLATDATLKTGLYPQKLRQAGIDCVTPDAAAQEKVMASIYALKAGDWEEAQRLMEGPYRQLAANVQAVILGCTEIPLILEQQMRATSSRFIDSNAALARSAIRWYEAKTGRKLLKSSQR